MAIFGFLTRRMAQGKALRGAYDRLIAQARHPKLFQQMGVPDTFDGRFESLALHLSILHLAMERPTDLHGVRQQLFERFVHELDNQMREMGVSDSGIARKMTKMAEHLYGRIKVYRTGLEQGNDGRALAESLAKNFDIQDAAKADALAAYARQAYRALENAEKSTQLTWCQWPQP